MVASAKPRIRVLRVLRFLMLRAGWAPLAVLALHLYLHGVLDLINKHPFLDIPMHLLGGAAVAFFLSCVFQTLPEGSMSPARRPFIEVLTVMGLTMAASILWELSEFLLDTYAGTSLQKDAFDTAKDMAVGIGGGGFYMLIAWLTGRVGRVRPIDA
jgi:hypothetical protein